MERLTIENEPKYCRHVKSGIAQWQAIERLAELEDELEDGTLVKLSCKVGDSVFVINYQWLKYKEYKVRSIEIKKSDIFFMLTDDLADCFNIHNSVWTITVSVNTFKDEWHLTREEAEKRLEELRE